MVGALYSLYALYASGVQAMMWGSLATFAGWLLFGLILAKDSGTLLGRGDVMRSRGD